MRLSIVLSEGMNGAQPARKTTNTTTIQLIHRIMASSLVHPRALLPERARRVAITEPIPALNAHRQDAGRPILRALEQRMLVRRDQLNGHHTLDDLVYSMFRPNTGGFHGLLRLPARVERDAPKKQDRGHDEPADPLDGQARFLVADA